MILIEKLKELEKNATPGPWKWEWYRGCLEYAYLKSGEKIVLSDGSACDEYSRDIDPDGPDAMLIAEMRNALPRLLAVVKAAKRVDDIASHGSREELHDALKALEDGE